MAVECLFQLFSYKSFANILPKGGGGGERGRPGPLPQICHCFCYSHSGGKGEGLDVWIRGVGIQLDFSLFATSKRSSFKRYSAGSRQRT